MEHQCSLSSKNKYTSVRSAQNILMFRLHKIRPLSLHKYALRCYWYANIWFVTIFITFRNQFPSWTRQNYAVSSHSALLNSTLTSPSILRSSTWVFSFRFFPYVPHAPSTSSSVFWSPEYDLWHSSLTKPSTLSHILPLRHTSSPQHPVAKHTQQLCPRPHRPTLRQEFLRTARRVYRQLEGVEGLQK
jgi:hypothetical protein